MNNVPQPRKKCKEGTSSVRGNKIIENSGVLLGDLKLKALILLDTVMALFKIALKFLAPNFCWCAHERVGVVTEVFRPLDQKSRTFDFRGLVNIL